MRIGAVIATVGLLAVLGSHCDVRRAAAADEPTLTAEDEAAFYRWWDGLGYPDVTKLPFVKAATANWIKYGDAEPTPIYEHGFLVGDAGKTFDLFATDLQRRRLEKTAPGVKEWDRVGYEPADFLAFVRAGLKTMQAHAGPVQWHEDASLDPFRAHRWAIPNQAFRMLVLARACEARGASDVAHELCTLALREQDGSWKDGPPPPAERVAMLKRDLQYEARLAVVERVEEPSAPLATLRDEFARLAKACPDDAETAADVKIIERMLAEAAERGRRAPTATAPSIDDLVFELRNSFIDARRLMAAPEEKGPPTASDRLARLGYAAAPALLAALADRSFTRQLIHPFTGHGQYRGDPRPYRVRDAAIDVLDQIAGGAFRDEDGSEFSLHPWKEDEWPALIERAKAWWKSASEKGEEAVLVEAVRKGGRSAIAPARRLVEAFPASALAALRAAIESTDEGYASGELIAAIEGLSGADATQYLLELLQTGRSQRARLSAAQALHKRGRREAVEAMAEEWVRPSKPEAGPRPYLPGDPGFAGDLLSFLASSGDDKAYAALGEGLGEKPPGLRFHVLSAFLGGGGHSVFAIGPTAGGGPAPKPDFADTPARRALEDLLGARLADDDEVDGVSMHVGGVEVDTRLGHVAARALAATFPEKYRYDAKAKPAEREAQRLAAENQWRQAHGLAPAVPPPPRQRPAAVADSVAKPAIDAVLAASDADAKAKSSAALVGLGLGALPAVSERLAALGKDAPGRGDLEAAAARIASIVSEVVLTKDSAKPDEPFQSILYGLRGKPFDRDAFVRLLLGVTAKPPTGVAGLRLRASRGVDLLGLKLAVTLVKEPTRSPGAPERPESGWTSSGPNVRVGERWSGGSIGTLNPGHEKAAKTWEYAATRVEEAIFSPPDVPVVVSFGVARGG